MNQKIKPGMYRRFDGEIFQVICVAQHTEGNYKLVIYESTADHPESDPKLASPEGVFEERVPHKGHLVPRFQRIEDTVCSESEKTGSLCTTESGPPTQ